MTGFDDLPMPAFLAVFVAPWPVGTVGLMSCCTRAVIGWHRQPMTALCFRTAVRARTSEAALYPQICVPALPLRGMHGSTAANIKLEHMFKLIGMTACLKHQSTALEHQARLAAYRSPSGAGYETHAHTHTHTCNKFLKIAFDFNPGK